MVLPAGSGSGAAMDTDPYECSIYDQPLSVAYTIQAVLAFTRGQHQQALQASRLALHHITGLVHNGFSLSVAQLISCSAPCP